MTTVYETPSMRWQPWLCVVVAIAVLVQMVLRSPNLAHKPFLLLPMVAVAAAVTHQAAVKVAWRLELTDVHLTVRFPWRRAIELTVDEVEGIRPKPRSALRDGTSQWVYLTTSAGTRYLVWAPRRKRSSLDNLREALDLVSPGRRSLPGQGKTL